jgi:phospho-N-acetylmuramoyl-pentapeptide-transferase
MAEATAAFVGFLLTLLSGGPAIRWLRRVGVGKHVRDDGPPSHLKKEGTPTMGGVFLIGSALAGGLVAALIFGQLSVQALYLVGLIGGFALIGLADDWRQAARGRPLGLRARYKLVGQFLIAGVFMYGMQHVRGVLPGLWITPWGEIDLSPGPVYLIAGTLVIVVTSNSVNLTDGADGLAAGLVALAGLSLGIWSLVAQPSIPVTVVAFALVGACLGFLRFNYHPAKVFMGDIGSLALGAGLAGFAILNRAEFWLLVFGLLFFVESLSVVIQVVSFRATGRRVFRMSPLHHHLELAGWSERRVVWSAWGAAVVLSGVTLLVCWHFGLFWATRAPLSQ